MTIRHGEEGFTLVELLVSLALMGMAAALLLQGVQMAGEIVKRENAGTADLDQIVTAQRIVRGRIERLRTITRLDSAVPIVDARGRASDFTFVAPPADRVAPQALQRFQLTRTASGDLVFYGANTRDGSIDQGGADLAGWVPETLLRGVTNLSISYFGVDQSGMRRWQARWWDRPTPPEMIRIRVEFAAGDRRSWPDLLVRPRATINAACRVDPLTGSCGEIS